jgi:DNA glycosylase AlkZ-like
VERDVVRATMFRGTLHLLTAADFLRLRTTVAPVLEAGLKVLGDRGAGLEPDKVMAAAKKLLAKEPLTFTEVRDALQKQFPEVNERALGFCTRMLVPLVMYPTDARWSWSANARFTPAEDWLGAKLHTRAEPKELVTRYLAAFGPATPADFQTWSGLQKAKPVFDDLELETFTDEAGKTLYDVPDGPRPDPDTPAPVRFLPEFDNLLLSHADRSRVVRPEHQATMWDGRMLLGTVLVDGFAGARWKLVRTRGAATIVVQPFVRLSGADRTALLEEGARLCALVASGADRPDVVIDPRGAKAR